MAQQLGSVAVGSIVKLNEGGSPVDFYVAKHDYESSLNGAGRTLVVRKDTYDDRVWDNGNVNAYASSDLDSWFNSTYKNMLDADIRSLIGTTKIRYTPGNGNNAVGTLKRAIFALSLTELGQSHTYAKTEGSALPIASTLRIAYRNGSATTQWTRSPNTGGTYDAWWLDSNGNIYNSNCSNSHGSRPAFTLPEALLVFDDGEVSVTVPPPSTIDVPTQAMQGNQITVSWAAVGGADGYILERKADTDSDWTRVYSGANLSFSETVGTWTSVQYRVKAGVSGTYGDYTTSASVPVVSASIVVISGTDGDLGTLTNDVSYVVSSDGTNPLTVVETINGVERTFTATNGATNKISVLDLPTGTGSIVITATTEVSSSPVTVTRTWTYSKTAITFPETGSVADLTKQGNTIWAKTIAEAVRTPGIWGGNLGLALSKLANAVLYDPETGGFNGIGGADATIPMVSIETGSYVGTGTFGQSNPNTINFSLNPQMVVIIDITTFGVSVIMVNPCIAATKSNTSSSGMGLHVTWGANSVSWYSDNSPNPYKQINVSNNRYHYIAIGVPGGAT